jgi:hypothetical protein
MGLHGVSRCFRWFPLGTEVWARHSWRRDREAGPSLSSYARLSGSSWPLLFVLQPRRFMLNPNVSARTNGQSLNPPSPGASATVDGSLGAVQNEEKRMILTLETTMHPSA